jgi:hypothetical protein
MKTIRDLGMKPGTATAVVALTVEVRVGAWNPDCTLEQAVSQATRDAAGKLARLLGSNKGIRITEATAVRVFCDAVER